MSKAKVKTTTNVIDPMKNFDVKPIKLSDINLSQSMPQKRRRKHYDKDNLAELAQSISTTGLIEPIVVRTKGKKFELVAGERRVKAHQLLKYDEIAASVRDLNDVEVLDIQITENLQREALDPMDEAEGYKYLHLTKGIAITEIAAKVGKSRKHIHRRLALNELINEFKDLIDNNHLPLRQAVVISRYPTETQKIIYGEQIGFWSREDDDGSLVIRFESPSDLLRRIERECMLDLKNAPFDVTSRTLHPTQLLTCGDCQLRTGARKELFDDLLTDEEKKAKTDYCLDRDCWQAKTTRNVEEKLVQITSDLRKEKKVDPDSKEAKKITALTISGSEYNIPDEYPDALYVDFNYDETRNKIKVLKQPKETCDSVEVGVLIAKANYGSGGDLDLGSEVRICRDKKCVKHWGKTVTQEDGTEKVVTGSDKTEYRERKEFLFDSRCMQQIRLRALSECSKVFTIDDVGLNKAFLDNEDGFLRMIELAMSDRFESDPSFLEYLADIDFTFETDSWEYERRRDKLLTADVKIRERLAFLIFHAYKSRVTVDQRVEDQTPIVELCQKYGVNYWLIDAEERLSLATRSYKKHIVIFEAHLDMVKNGYATRVPRPYGETFSTPHETLFPKPAKTPKPKVKTKTAQKTVTKSTPAVKKPKAKTTEKLVPLNSIDLGATTTHKFEKKSLVTEAGGYDNYTCSQCGLKGKRHGLSERLDLDGRASAVKRQYDCPDHAPKAKTVGVK